MQIIRVVLSNGVVKEYHDSPDEQFELECAADGRLTISVRQPSSVPDGPSQEVAQYSGDQYESFEQRIN